MMASEEKCVDLTNVNPKEWKPKYIGNGYRNCCYVPVRGGVGRITLFGYGKDGTPTTFICPHRSHIKYAVKYKTEERDTYGNYVATRYFDSTYDRARYLKNMGDTLLVDECLKPEQEFLQQMFSDDVFEGGFNEFPIRTFFLDIETEISESFEYPSTARNRINMLTVYDTKTEKYYTWSLNHAEISFGNENIKDLPKDKFVLFEFNDNEVELLSHFLSWWESNYCDVVATWNGRAYDIPYIVRRLENVLGKDATKRISPVHRYRIVENDLTNKRANRGAEILVDIDGIGNADLLELYKTKFNIPGSPLDGGYGLSNVGEHEGLGTKVKYSGTLKDLYTKNYQMFYEYNIIDVDLLRRIEQKVKMIPLARKITSFGLSKFDLIYKSTPYLTGSLVAFAKSKMHLVMRSNVHNKEKDLLRYEGAYVVPNTPMVVKNGVMTQDYASLYPNTLICCNASPETYVGKISLNKIKYDTQSEKQSFISEPPIELDKDRQDVYYVMAANGQQKPITRKKLEELLDTKCIFTRNNTLFLKHEIKEGVTTKWCSYFYAMRKSTKKKMKKLEMDLYNNKIPEDQIGSVKTQIQNLDSTQLAIKIGLINSLYGMLGEKNSCIFNIHIAQTITRQGRYSNISGIEFVTKILKERFNVPDTYKTVVGGDSDSFFTNIECITSDFKKKYGLCDRIMDWPGEYKLKLWDYLSDIVENNVNPMVRDRITKYCHTSKAGVLGYTLEYVGDVGVYQAKKMYGVHKMILEGPELVDKIVYKGIELKKGNIPSAVKKYLNDIYTGVLTKNWNSSTYKDYLNSAYDEFCGLTEDQIAWWKGYNTKRESDGFLHMKKMYNEETGRSIGDTAISSACTYYNQLLQHLKIGSKYSEILLGDKVRFFYVKPQNKYGLKYIAFKDGEYPEEFKPIFQIDYDVMFDKMVVSTLKNFCIATGFPTFSNNQNLMDVDDL